MSLQNLAFTKDEYKSRLARTQAAMAELKLDAFLVSNRADVCFLTGIETCYSACSCPRSRWIGTTGCGKAFPARSSSMRTR